ncbi:MAG: CoA-binding protein [Deltaproteobacteria bacterium]|nr:CoA-binding protein [Candidatus Zymogenaceae bacterium]
MTLADRDVMEAIFAPKSVAIVGVPAGMKMGRLFLMGLLSSGYRGALFLVNPKLDELDGMKVLKQTRDIPGPLDLAIVLVPREKLLDIIDELGEVGTKAAVIFTAGLGELGSDGMKQQEQLVDRAREHGIRLIGPNCQGVYAPRSGLSFFPAMPTTVGNVSFVSGSGSLASLSVGRGASRGMYFNKVISFGNAADLTASDFFSHFGDDPETKVIISYIEGIPEGRRFFETVMRVSALKPVVVWKAGLSDFGARAAQSHTGALAGDERIWHSALIQAGAVPVSGMDELIDTAMIFSFSPRPVGDRVAILSGPGGLAVSAADAAARVGLRLATLSDETQKKIAAVLPPAGISIQNPVDVGLGASGIVEQYTKPARYLMEDDGVDVVVVIGGTFVREMNQAYRRELIAARNDTNKILIAVNLPEFARAVQDDDTDTDFLNAGIPVYPSPERAMIALGGAVRYGRYIQRERRESA